MGAEPGRTAMARAVRDMPLARLIPNALTMMALCSGLTAIRFALQEKWEAAVLAVVIAGIFDVLDGRVARMLNITSRFGAELDSLADLISFGVAPALILYTWALKTGAGGLGWVAVLAFVVCTAMRLARFNTMLDENIPAWAKSYFTGVPSPGGAALALLPLVAVLEFGDDVQLPSRYLAVWTIVAGGLMVSRLPTLSMKGRRVAPLWVAPIMLALCLIVAALITNPWLTLSVMGALYLGSLPVGLWLYRRRARLEGGRS